jgi:hypothetical protein
VSGGITFDAGALIAIDRNDRRILALLARAKERKMRVTIPATALAQVIRNPARQARLARLIRQADTDLAPLDARDATAVGLVLARSGTADIAKKCGALHFWTNGERPLMCTSGQELWSPLDSLSHETCSK